MIYIFMFNDPSNSMNMNGLNTVILTHAYFPDDGGLLLDVRSADLRLGCVGHEVGRIHLHVQVN